jgi:hypothetical protein
MGIAIPGWFRDSISRVLPDAAVVRMNEDSDLQIRAICYHLGWSYARVVRVLVNKGLEEMQQRSDRVA